MRGLKLLPVLLASALATPAMASGYGLREHSVDSMGAAFAGAAAQSGDPTYMAYNPASLAGVEDGDMAISVIGLFPHTDASYPTALTAAGTPAGGEANPSEFVNDAIVPAIAFRQRLSERWAVGLSVNVPWGLKTEYPGNWAGRYYALKTRLTVATITPMISYEVTPNFAVAGGVIAQYAKGTLSNAVDFGTLGALFSIPGSVPGAFDGRGVIENADDWSWGWVVGAMFHAGDRATIGVSYRSSVDHTLEGPLKFTLDGAGIGSVINGATGMFADTHMTVKVTTPDVVAVGLRFQFSDRWTGLVGADWTNWSRFRSLDVHAANPAQPVDVTTANWDDSWFVSAGLEYAASDAVTLRAGTGYDDTPVPDSTRTPRIPDNGRFWLAAGATWHATDALDVKFAYAHLFLDDASIDLSPADSANAFRGTLAGTSSVGADVLGVEFAWRW